MNAITAYIAARKYINDTAIGLGAVKGSNCTITNIIETDNNSNEVIFKWTGTDGTEQTRKMTVKNGEDGADGVSIVSVNLDDDNRLTCTLSDGTVEDCGAVNVVTDVAQISYTNAEEPTVNSVKTALDLLFEEGGGVLEAEIKPNVTMGSVKNSYPAGTSLEEIIRDMLTVNVAPSVTITLNPTTTIYEESKDSISSLTINAMVTKQTSNIAKIEYYINNTLVKTTDTGVATGGLFPYIYNLGINNDATIKVVVTDTEGLTGMATKTITFIGQSYYGLVDADTSEPTEALIKTLNKTLKTTKKYVYTGITTDWAKICYAYPAELGKLTSIMDKINNFNYTASFQFNTRTVNGIDYYVYTLIEPTGAEDVELTFE